MKRSNKQNGFTMLEVVLAIVIIAIASFGIYKLHNSSTLKSKLRSEEETISDIYSGATSFSFNRSHQPIQPELFSMGILPLDIWPAYNQNIKGAFGPIVYSSDNGSTKTYAWSLITAKKIPGSVADELCAHMENWADVFVNDQPYKGETAPIFQSSELYTIKIYFPKGKCTEGPSQCK